MTRNLIKTWHWIAVGLLVAGAGGGALHRLSSAPSESPPQEVSAAEGAPVDSRGQIALPAFRLADLDGRRHDIRQWRGKVVVLSFWATWCLPCRRDLPVFKALQAQYGPEGVQFVGIALDGAALVRRYVYLEGLDYPQLLDDAKAPELDRLLGNKLGVLPFTVVVDRKGRVAQRIYGEWSHDDAAATLKRLL